MVCRFEHLDETKPFTRRDRTSNSRNLLDPVQEWFRRPLSGRLSYCAADSPQYTVVLPLRGVDLLQKPRYFEGALVRKKNLDNS